MPHKESDSELKKNPDLTERYPWIEKDISEIYDFDLDGKPVAAVKDVIYQGMLNTFYREEYDFAAKKIGIRNIFDFADDKVILMNLAQIRENNVANYAVETADLVKKSDKKIDPIYIFNKIFAGKIRYMPQTFNCTIADCSQTKFFIGEAPLDMANAVKAARSSALIHGYTSDMPWILDDETDIEFFAHYWDTVYAGPLKMMFENHMSFRLNSGQFGQKFRHFVDAILPKGTKRRENVKKLFPRKGMFFRTIQKLINI